MTLELPEKLSRYVRKQMSKLGYENPIEYLAAVLEAERHRDLRREVEAMLEEGLEGPSSPLTNKDFEDIERVGLKILARRRRK
jgi:hypothetical protein